MTTPAQQLLQILDDSSKNENDVQAHLESFSELIPQPFMLNHDLNFNLFVAKPPVGLPYKADFLYLTKSSQEWHIVLIEIERQSKRIFSGIPQDTRESADFTEAMDQIKAWQEYNRRDPMLLPNMLRPLMRPAHMSQNPVSFRYVLVIGRSSEFTVGAMTRRDRLQTHNSHHDVRVMTYDSILSDAARRDAGARPNILAVAKNSFRFKRLNSEPWSIFAHLTPGELLLDKTDEDTLRKWGYDLDAWKKGELLTYNNKHPASAAFGKSINILDIDVPK